MICSRSFFIMMPLGFLVAFGVYMRVVYVQLGAPTALSDWCVSITRQKAEIAAQTPSPKLVVLGGSASFFGLKASVLEKELGVPTVNAATHAGLGMAYILERGKKLLRPGDTVVLLPEYEVLTCGERNRLDWASFMYLDYIFSGDPDYYRSLPIIDQAEIGLMTSFKRLTKGLASHSHAEPPFQFTGYYTYDPSLVDAHGDMTGHLAERRPAVCPVRDKGVCLQLMAELPHNAPGLKLLTDFCKWAAENRVRVLYSFPNMADQPAYHQLMALAVETQLNEFFTGLGVPVVGRLSDSLMPPAEFFDTNYHPTEEAAIRRTNRFSAQLKPWFAPSRSTVPPGGNR